MRRPSALLERTRNVHPLRGIPVAQQDVERGPDKGIMLDVDGVLVTGKLSSESLELES